MNWDQLDWWLNNNSRYSFKLLGYHYYHSINEVHPSSSILPNPGNSKSYQWIWEPLITHSHRWPISDVLRQCEHTSLILSVILSSSPHSCRDQFSLQQWRKLLCFHGVPASSTLWMVDSEILQSVLLALSTTHEHVWLLLVIFAKVHYQPPQLYCR